MRVLYLITRADLGGAQVHVLDLLAGFGDRIEPVVAVGEDGFFTESARKLGVECHVLSSLVHPISPTKDFRALCKITALIRSLDPDVVHVHTSKAGVIGRTAAWLAGKPSVFTAHTWCFAEGTSWKWRLVGVPAERLAARFSSAIVNVSDANRNLALRRRIGRPDRLLRIWNGIADVPHRARPSADQPPRIVMVARFAPQKDHALLLRAAAAIAAPFEIVFVGDGPTEPAMRAEAARLGIANRVRFLGERKDVGELLASAQIFALPSKWEGLPLSILEAMRAGLPVLASDVGGVAESVVDGKTGFLAAPGDLVGFRARLRDLIESPALRRRLGDAGRARYEADFTVEAMLSRTFDVYRRAAAEAAGRQVFRRGASPPASADFTRSQEGNRL